jgi:predicted alpha/beta hydrolase family esterase
MQRDPKIKVIFIPGNGGGGPNDNWFPYLKTELEKLGFTVIASEFPDNKLARASYWLPFLEELGADENTILIGHSSGAIAAMRFAESKKILGSVLVGTYHTDLGLETEKLSGYFDRPWNWEPIKRNQQWIAIYASTDDPWIPIEEPRFVKEQLDAAYFEYTDQGHFGGDYFKESFEELVTFIAKHIHKPDQQ